MENIFKKNAYFSFFLHGLGKVVSLLVRTGSHVPNLSLSLLVYAKHVFEDRLPFRHSNTEMSKIDISKIVFSQTNGS